MSSCSALRLSIPADWKARPTPFLFALTAISLEELQHEAREALIEHLGPAHRAYRVRVRRYHS